MSHLGFKLKISGLVQGVGFRPFVYKLALKFKLLGEVRNDGFGVLILLKTDLKTCHEFIKKLNQTPPPLARIDGIKLIKTKVLDYKSFSIKTSKNTAKTTPMLSDFALCAKCKKEFLNPKNPRFNYPFITCVNCGPRFSIIKALPYDRKNTTMKTHKMCKFCQNEYENPKNRRFHAQPISCPKCAINLHLKDKNGAILSSNEEALKAVSSLLKVGKIIAFKGLGGFHLLCDALNEKAVLSLRERKNRPLKPFALMCENLESAKKLAFINKYEAKVLQSQLAPIVILKAKKEFKTLAPNIDKIGIMLAYTPLHILLFKHFKGVLLATSANLSGESIIYDESKLEKISSVFDFYVDYEREISNSSDDSIVQVLGKKTMFLRTSRGVNPYYLQTNFKQKGCFLALGAELKNEFVIFYKNKLLISPYMGDLKSLDVEERFLKILAFFKQNYNLKFDEIILDKHPNFSYLRHFKGLKVQHHYAHFCAAYFEYEKEFKPCENALGFVFDGTGYGENGEIWGGEILLGNLKEYERIAHFESFKLINSDIKNLQNLALSVIWHYDLENLAHKFLSKFDKTKLENLKKIHQNSSLKTSSLGRIIDAFGSIVFDIEKISYEAQIGLMCEKFYDESLDFAYKFSLKNGVIDFNSCFIGAFKDDKTKAVSGFLNGLADFIISFSKNYKQKVLLSGGVFQNKTLLEILIKRKFKFFVPLKFPSNDSSIALGQMVHFLNTKKA